MIRTLAVLLLGVSAPALAQPPTAGGLARVLWHGPDGARDVTEVPRGQAWLRLEGVRRRVLEQLRRAFGEAAEGLEPRRPVDVVVQRLEIVAEENDLRLSALIDVTEPSDGSLLYTGWSRVSHPLEPGLDEPRLAQLADGLARDLAQDAASRFLVRIGHGTGPTGSGGGGQDWLGLMVGAPGPLLVGWRHGLAETVDLELGLAPGWPQAGLSAGALWRPWQGDGVGLHLGAGVAAGAPLETLDECATRPDDGDKPRCEVEPAMAWGHLRAGLVLRKGRHSLSLDGGGWVGWAWKPVGSGSWWQNGMVGMSWFYRL